MSTKLPPMPPSDDQSMQFNKYDHYYQTRSGDFWGRNEVTRIEDIPPVKCDHYYIYVQGGIECKKCHCGLIGPLEIKDGKPYYQGERIVGL